jgi:hypothetical protein
VKDTPPAVERAYQDMLTARSNADRFLAGCSMFATARSLVVASEREKDPAASPPRLRVALILRLCEHEFTSAERERIVARISHQPSP